MPSMHAPLLLTLGLLTGLAANGSGSVVSPFSSATPGGALPSGWRVGKLEFAAGPSHGYLWILARTPTLPDEVLEPLLDQARDAGFDLTGLIWVKQGRARIPER